MILVVDDSHDMQDLLKIALSDDGFEVKTASNGKEALQMIDCENLPSLIFLDSKMDIMDGQEFLKALEKHCVNLDNTQKMSVIVMSGSDEPLKSPLITATLRKPVDLDQLHTLATKYATKKTSSQHP
jgi:CheY-like chemotaxis protein